MDMESAIYAVEDEKFDIKTQCHVNSNEDGDRFVGIKAESDKAMVYFPIGYELPESDAEIRTDIKHFQIIGKEIFPQPLFQRVCQIFKADVRKLPAFSAHQMIVLRNPIIPIRASLYGHLSDQPRLAQLIQIIIYGSQRYRRIRLLQLGKNLIRGQMSGKLTDNLINLLFVFRHRQSTL